MFLVGATPYVFRLSALAHGNKGVGFCVGAKERRRSAQVTENTGLTLLRVRTLLKLNSLAKLLNSQRGFCPREDGLGRAAVLKEAPGVASPQLYPSHHTMPGKRHYLYVQYSNGNSPPACGASKRSCL
jgi:hypothetical protein